VCSPPLDLGCRFGRVWAVALKQACNKLGL
jgi:hypothetical protein